MHKLKHDNNHLLKVILKTGQILIAIGTPPLFALKILIWASLWLGNSLIKLIAASYSIAVNTLETFLWLTRSVILGQSRLMSSLPGHSKLIWLKIKENLSFPNLNFPTARKPSRRITVRKIRREIPVWLILLRKIHLPKFKFIWPKVKIPHFWPGDPKIFRRAVLGLIFLSVFIFVAVQGYAVIHELPSPKLLASQPIPVTTKIYDRNGILLYEFYKNQNRTPVNLSSLPKYVVDAAIVTEDKNFYNHPGFDVVGIVRAAIANSSGEINQGGSTITQQLVRFALLNQKQTLTRKIRELILAYWAEHLYSKEQILTMYLNEIPYGGSAYGIEAASQTIFKKHAKDLTLAQAALLAGLPSSPTTYSPFGSHPKRAIDRQHQVLSAMASQGYISDFAARTARNEPLDFAPTATEIKAPHFVMFVHDLLSQKYGEETVYQGGLQVITSLDYNLYQSVAQILETGVANQKYLNVGNGAVLITNPKTGEILSMNGSTNFFDKNHGNVNVTISQRSPGSSIKPLNYALAFEKGIITPSTIIDDSPIIYNSLGSPPYSPQNYDNRFHGRVTARVALASSYNIPAVKVLEKNGLINFIQFATNLGLTTLTDPSRYGLSLTLGGGEVKMTDMAVAYSTFANSGQKVNLNPIVQIKDYRGNLLEDSNNYELRTNNSRVLSPRTAFLISNILADDGARAPTFGSGSYLNLPGHTVSVKTGTAQDKRDNWTIGYSFGPNSRLVAVWVGNNDNSPMSPYLESGNTGAAAIWNPVMKELLKNDKDYPIPKPEDLIEVRICALTGTLPCENCPYVSTEYFTRGTEPKTACSISKDDLEKFKKNFKL